MTAITYTGAVPTVGADEDTWGTELNTSLGQVAADLSMLNTAPANTILGRNEGTSGEVERLTVTEATAMLNAFGGDAGSGGVKGLVPATVSGDKRKVLTGAGTWQHGYGRAFGCVITTTNINGSQPTFTNGMNVASLSTLSVVTSQSSCVVTFTDPLPNATYGVFTNSNGSLSASETSYGSKTTTTVTLYWDNTGGTATEISVSGFI